MMVVVRIMVVVACVMVCRGVHHNVYAAAVLAPSSLQIQITVRYIATSSGSGASAPEVELRENGP